MAEPFPRLVRSSFHSQALKRSYEPALQIFSLQNSWSRMGQRRSAFNAFQHDTFKSFIQPLIALIFAEKLESLIDSRLQA